MWVVFCVLACNIWLSTPVHSSLNDVEIHGMGLPGIGPIPRSFSLETRWVPQKLDHTNPEETSSWKQRFMVRNDFYKSGGPVFLLLGGESQIQKAWMYNSAMTEYAKKMNALCYQLEHRYYGVSDPTGDTSDENLKYLTIDQALADIAEFITFTVENQPMLSGAKWIVFGGSYAGNLAAWARMTYPHLIHAAVSNSAPLYPKVAFTEFLESVEKTVALYSKKCVRNINQALTKLKQLFKSDEGRNIIMNTFNLCALPDIENDDVTNLFYTVLTKITSILVSQKDDRYYKNVSRYDLTISKMCDIMNDSTSGDQLERLINMIHPVNKNNRCVSFIYLKQERKINFLKQNSRNSDNLDERLWLYQMCTEFGFFIVSINDSQMFAGTVQLDYYYRWCSELFGDLYNLETLKNKVKRRNALTEKLYRKTERIIYVHGTHDPWRELGIIHTTTPNTVSILIEGTGHCANMRYPTPNDPIQLTEARLTIASQLKKWLIEHK